jgi:TolB-like protein
MTLLVELKRRNVFKVGIVYAVSAWVLLQITDIVSEILVLPDWAPKLILVILAVGFIPALIFAWAFELTPEGVKKEKDIDRSQSITPATGSKLNIFIGSLLAIALTYIAYDKLLTGASSQTKPASNVQTKATEINANAPTTTEIEKPEPADARKSIVVLPFINMSNDPEQEFFSDGLSEELLNVLARIKDLRVISRTSAFAFKGKDIDIPTIAAQLNVSHVLEGSVRKAGNDIRITVQLIEVATDSHLWSEAYNRKLENVFEIQEEISTAIVHELQVTLGTRSAELAYRPTENLEAYQLFLRGRHLYQARGDENVLRSIELLKNSLDIDPEFADAWANLAAASAVQAFSTKEGFRKLEEQSDHAAQRAIDLDPGNGLAHAVLGLRLTAKQQWEQAISELAMAIDLNPSESNSLLWMGITLNELGYIQQAIKIMKRGEFVDPVFTNMQSWLSNQYISTGELEKAQGHQDKAIELNPDWENIGFENLELSRGNLGLAEQEALASLDDDSNNEQINIKVFYEALRDPSKTGKSVPTSLSGQNGDLSNRAFNYLLMLGAVDEAIRFWHEKNANGRGLRASNDLTFLWYVFNREQLNNPSLVPFFESTGMADYWRKHGNPDYCRVDGDQIECGEP